MSEENENIKKELPNKKGRIIVRNLVYDIQENHLKKLFNKYGEITEINLPLNPSTNKAKGFAFVQFANKNHALKAIKELNSSNYKGRTILLDLAFEKREYETLNKKNKIEIKKNPQEQEENKSIEIENNEEKLNDDNDSKSLEIENEENEEIEENEENKIEEEIRKKQEKLKKITETEKDFDHTIFISNLPYDLEEKEFKSFFQNYGELLYAKLVINKETGERKGTGFVKFKEKEVADQLISLSESQEHGETEENNNLEIKGRRIFIKKAITRDDVVKKISEEQKKTTPINIKKIKTLNDIIKLDKNGKRKLYLVKYGVHEPDNNMNEIEKEKRTIYTEEKIEKLKNPNYFISETRILIKHLPKNSFDENTMKEIIQKFLKETYDPKIIKKKKILKDIKLLRDKEKITNENQLASKGICFVEFKEHEDALNFIIYFSKPENYSQLNPNRIPIIEFSIEDIRKQKKIEKKISNSQNNNEININHEEKKKKSQESNAKTHTYKVLIEQLIEEKNPNSLELIKEHLKNVKSRGIKQRLNNKIKAVFNIQEKEKIIDIKKPLVNENSKKKKINKIQKKINEKNNANFEKKFVELKKIEKDIKKQKKIKRKAEENDDFDEIAEKYRNKVQKKVKWTN